MSGGHDDHGHGDAHGGHEGHGEEHGHDEHGHDEGHGGHEEHEEHGTHEEHGHDSHGEEGHGDHGQGGHDDHGHGNDHAGHEEKHEKKAAPKPDKKKRIGEATLLMIIAVAVVWRIAMEPLPSVEPIIPIAVFTGLVYGNEAGIILGLVAYPLSNLFMEGGILGFWTILQSISGAIAGGITAYARKINADSLVYYTFIGTLIFELLLNIPDGALIIWPFSVIHIVSNIIIAILLTAFLPKQ